MEKKRVKNEKYELALNQILVEMERKERRELEEEGRNR